MSLTERAKGGNGGGRRKAPRARAPATLASLYDAMRSAGWEPGRKAGWNEALTRKNYAALLGSRTSAENLLLACACTELLALHSPDTVRGNMYRVVSAGWLPDTSGKSYDRVQRLLNRLRINRTIPFEWVVDNIRATIKPSSWSGLADYAETVRDSYRKSFWPHLPDYVEVICEKDAVAGTVAQVTREFDVRLHPIRGYNSTTFAWEIARFWNRIEKPIHVYYVGDHDPSGRDLERDIREKTARFADREVTWERIAVQPAHFQEFGIRPLAPKKKDSRTVKFVREWGEECSEVEAIPANDLRAMLRERIERHIPQEQWERLQEVERLEQEQWEQAMDWFRRSTDNNPEGPRW